VINVNLCGEFGGPNGMGRKGRLTMLRWDRGLGWWILRELV
jgi:hypothetical protein